MVRPLLFEHQKPCPLTLPVASHPPQLLLRHYSSYPSCRQLNSLSCRPEQHCNQPITAKLPLFSTICTGNLTHEHKTYHHYGPDPGYSRVQPGNEQSVWWTKEQQCDERSESPRPDSRTDEQNRRLPEHFRRTAQTVSAPLITHCMTDSCVARGPAVMLTKDRYLPAIGRFLIVVTFIEDALRIITQWNDQLLYLKDFRHSKISHVQQKARATSKR